MSYTTVAKVYETLPALGSVSNITSSHISTAITQAESIINGRIGNIYTVPLSVVPQIIETVTIDMTLYRLSRRFFTTQRMRETNDFIKPEEINDLLDKIANGELRLITNSGTVVDMQSTILSNNYEYTPTFSEDDFENSEIDDDKI